MASLARELKKCVLLNDDTKKTFQAHFNPKEISWDKSIPWQKHKRSKGDNPLMEFTGAQPSKLSVELFFDTYETKKNVHNAYIAELQELCRVQKYDDGLRPPLVVFMWGNEFPKFKGVIESLAVKYTMFLSTGKPVRATATLKITHAGLTKSKVKKRGPEGRSDNPRPGERGHDLRSSSKPKPSPRPSAAAIKKASADLE
jgi:hypothetical protein